MPEFLRPFGGERAFESIGDLNEDCPNLAESIELSGKSLYALTLDVPILKAVLLIDP